MLDPKDRYGDIATIQSVPEFLAFLRAYPPAASGDQTTPVRVWFRGQGDLYWPLRPAVGRDRFVQAASGFDDLDYTASPWAFERFVVTAFFEQTAHLLPSHLTPVERYFIAQHHGVPTRLLDWTTNPLIALYFAVSDRSADGRDAGVFFYGHENGDVHLPRVDQNDSTVASLVAAVLERGDIGRQLLAVRPNASQLRISPQFAQFTVHGLGRPVDGSTLEEDRVAAFPINAGNAERHVVRVPDSAKRNVLSELRVLGVTKSQVFPDLAGIAGGILEEFGL